MASRSATLPVWGRRICLATPISPGGRRPVKDVSLAGDRAGLAGARSGSFWPFWNLMKALRTEGRAPRLIVIENVTGLLTSHDGKDFASICDALTEAGYRFGAVVIDASLFVPQSRERVFIVAVDADTPIPSELIADRPGLPFHPAGLGQGLQSPRLCAGLVASPCPAGAEHRPCRHCGRRAAGRALAYADRDRPHHRNDGPRQSRQGRGGEASRQTDGRHALPAHPRRFALGSPLRRPRRMSSGAERRIEPSDGQLVNGASVRTRLLSPRECARLMGLPNSYKLPANVNEALGLMGDGVVAQVVRHLTENLHEPLLGPAHGRREAFRFHARPRCGCLGGRETRFRGFSADAKIVNLRRTTCRRADVCQFSSSCLTAGA